MMLFSQIPTPIPTSPNWPTTPTYGGGGGNWTNPANWTSFVATIGIPTFLLLVCFAALAYVWWSGRKEPSNSDQVAILKWMYHDAIERNARLRRVLRSFCDVVAIFAVKADVDVKDKIERIQDALDAGPPPVPTELLIDSDARRKDM